MDQGMSEYSGFISANRNTVKPHFIAPRFTAKLAYHQEFLQSRFSYVVITILYNKILQPWTDYFSFWIKLNKFVFVFFSFVFAAVKKIKLRGKFPENNKRYICISNPNMAIQLTDVCYGWMCLLQGVINVRLSIYLTITGRGINLSSFVFISH